MLERPRRGERSLLLHIGLHRPCHEDETQEFRALAESAGAEVVGELHARRDRPDARYFVGEGKVEELAERVRETGTELILVNRALSPSQERNLENRLKARVLDRNGLILDIFAQRAATFEGKLQVELAQHEHLASRLVRGWSHLERQKGGIGLRGPGETQLEVDRRLLDKRIKRLRERLARVERQREVGRKERRRAQVPTVALVGYTNAGKTSLFNALAGANQNARDQLFATLDPTVRRLNVGGADELLLVDTVGFVRDLPHELVAAFKATLTETREAALLLHVVDLSDPHHEERQHQVENVLREIGAADVPVLRVYNKADKAEAAGLLPPDAAAEPKKLVVSALTGQGLDSLIEAVRRQLFGERRTGRVVLGPEQSRLRAELHEWRAVRHERPDERGGWIMDVELTPERWRRVQQDGARLERGRRQAGSMS